MRLQKAGSNDSQFVCSGRSLRQARADAAGCLLVGFSLSCAIDSTAVYRRWIAYSSFCSSSSEPPSITRAPQLRGTTPLPLGNLGVRMLELAAVPVAHRAINVPAPGRVSPMTAARPKLNTDHTLDRMIQLGCLHAAD